MTTKIKKITICADDYGINDTVNTAILNLASAKRISALSCMTLSSYWPKAGKDLIPFFNEMDIGIHFDLTEFYRLNENITSLNNWIKKGFTRQINKTLIKTALDNQIENFFAITGQYPDFIDGHQHVHILPIIREVIVEKAIQLKINKPLYIRIPATVNLGHFFKFNDFPKRQILMLLGCWPLRKLLEKNNIPYNKSFSGIYNFCSNASYPQKFLSFVNEIENQGLIMCHPGLENLKDFDLIAQNRWQEFQYLMSDHFIEYIITHNIKITRLLE